MTFKSEKRRIIKRQRGSIRSIAEAAGVSASLVSNWLVGRSTSKTVEMAVNQWLENRNATKPRKQA